MVLCRYKDTMRRVEMKYGQNTTRWQTSLNTSWRGAEAGDGAAETGGGVVVVGFSAERITPGQVNMWVK